MARPQPTPRPAPVQWLRLRYSKLGPIRFASQRDLARVIERAIQRAEIPIEYSSGFTPHPRISYANSVPTGAASHAEYFEIGLSRPCEAAEVGAQLNAKLPRGVQIEAVHEVPKGQLGAVLQASCWELNWTAADPGVLAGAAAQLVAAPQAEVERQTKRGVRRFDVRGAIAALTNTGSKVQVVLRHGDPLVRPDDVVAALVALAPPLACATVLFTRLEQGLLVGSQVVPWVAARNDSGQ